MTKCVFIAGTDTDVGKTYISSLILKALKAERILTSGFKPIASGGQVDPEGQTSDNALLNLDALTLQRHSGLDLPYHVVNPFCFAPAIAPHVAAADAGVRLTVAALDQAFANIQRAYPKRNAEGKLDNEDPKPVCPELILTEGAGGWHVPLNEQERLSDWVIGQKMGVILVVGLKLGCINHALLSCEAITRAGLPLLGWVANRPAAESMSREAETLSYLKASIDAPLIADVGFSNDPQHEQLDAKGRQALMAALN